MALSQKQLSAKRAKKAAKAKEKKVEAQKLLNQKQNAVSYPKFIFSDYDESVVSADFVSHIKAAFSELEFTSNLFSERDRWFYQVMKKSGYHSALNTLYGAFVSKGQIIEHDETMNHAAKNKLSLFYAAQIGTIIYKQLNEKGLLEKYLPYNDCQVETQKHLVIDNDKFALGEDFKVSFKALHKTRAFGGAAYYSWHKPQIEFEGRTYTVAFSRHALERVAERCAVDPSSYVGSGDVFAFIAKCTYYEPCILDNDGQLIHGFTFYEYCSPGFHSWRYVDNLIDNPSNEEKYIYRVGYCPVDLSGDFAKARTLLTPGMKGTPEEVLIRKISDPNQRQQTQNSTQNQTSIKRQAETDDFEAIKFFHNGGIPQILTTDKVLYKYQ